MSNVIVLHFKSNFSNTVDRQVPKNILIKFVDLKTNNGNLNKTNTNVNQ